MTWDLLADGPKSVAEFGLTWLCQSSALLAIGLVAGRLLRRQGPAVQSAAYRTTLLAVLVCPVASTLLAGAGFDGITLRLPVAAPVVAQARPAPMIAAAPIPEIAPGRLPEPIRPLVPVESTPRVVASAAVPPPVEPPTKARASRVDWLAAGVAIGLSTWAVGALLIASHLALGLRAMARLRGSAIPAGPVEEALCLDVARRMRLAAPEVLLAPFLHSPCVDGLRRPAILLPDDSGGDLRDTFVHELAHLARRDVWWNLLRQAASSLLWFQPLLWVLSRRMEVTAEEVCDDYVVQFGADRATYAGLLVELARRTLPPAPSTALGMVSLRSLLARRVVRILDSSRAPSTKAGTRAVLLILVAGLAGTSLAGLLGIGGPRRLAMAKDDVKPDEKDGILRGQVVGPDGQPVPGASVIASVATMAAPDGIGEEHYWNKRHEYTNRTADAEGRFELPSGPAWREIIAKAPGFGLAIYLKDRPFQLSAGDRPITGRLVDLEGRPVAGASVRLLQLYTLPDPKDRREADARPGPYQFPYHNSLGLDGEPALPGGVVTDADGRFRIEGLGLDVLANLKISGPTVALKKVKVMTRAMSRVFRADAQEPGSMGVDEPGFYGADCTIVVQPSRPIEGVVRDLATKEPIPGATVTASRIGGQDLNIEGQITAETDAQGRYRLLGLPKGNGHKLSVYPPLDRPYFITAGIEVPSRPGLDAVTCDIALRRGIWITGRVANAKTSEAVMASVDYFPFLTNGQAKDYPNFDPDVTSIEVKTRYRTDSQGRFRVVGLPGRGVVTARSDDRAFRTGSGGESIAGRNGQGQIPTYDNISTSNYTAIREVDVPAGRESTECDLPLDPGGSVVLKFVDEAGRPVSGVVAEGRFPTGADVGDHNVYGATSAKVGGLEPGKPRTVVLTQDERKIGAIVELPADGPRDGREQTVVLRPNASISGRIVFDRPIPPQAGVEVRTLQAEKVEGYDDTIAIDNIRIGADGRFRSDDLPPGGTYSIRAVERLQHGYEEMRPGGFRAFAIAVNFRPKAGEVVDLGTFDAKLGQRVEAPARVEAKKADPADVPIEGRIIDLEGRPVAGVSVTIDNFRAPKSGDLTPWIDGARQGQPPWVVGEHIDWDRKVPEAATKEAKTDVDGRFRLEGFGAERVVSLKLRGDTIAQASLDVATRKMDSFPASGFSNHNGPGAMTIFGADFTYTAALGRPVEGVVKDARTGAPLAGAEVRSYRFAGSDFAGIMTLRTRADDQGRFRLTGLPKGKGNMLIIVPADDQPYLMQEVDLPDTPGAGAIPVEVALQRGVWIEGTITEEGTGKPVAGAWMNYMPFRDNPFAQAHPVFDSDGNSDGTGFQDRYLSKADGTFRLVGLPGRAIVGASVHGKAFVSGAGSEAIEGMNKHGHFPTYNNPIPPGKMWPTVMKEIKPSADAEVVRVDLQARTGPLVRLKVVDASGQPVVGTSTRGLAGRGSWERESLAASEGEAKNLMTDEERSVLILHDGRKIGKAVRVRKGDDANGPVVVTLEPLSTIAGRVLDADGHPVRGATVRTDVLPGGDFSLSLGQVATDEKGAFRVLGVPTGCDYALAVDNNTVAMKDRNFAFVEKLVVKPGETTEVGDIRFKKD